MIKIIKSPVASDLIGVRKEGKKMVIPVTTGVERKRDPGYTTVVEGKTRFDPNTKAWLVLAESQRAADQKGWTHNCGTDILGVQVFLTVLDGLFPLSSGGETVREIVPYCPKCELKPEGHGTIDPQRHILVQALLE